MIIVIVIVTSPMFRGFLKSSAPTVTYIELDRDSSIEPGTIS